MKIIDRDEYLQQLLNVKDVPDIKVITGVRRSGKSKLMDMFHETIQNDNSNVIHIKLNLKEFEKLLNKEELYNYVSSKYDSKKNNYLLIDEIQMCIGFETIINNLHEEEKYDIYLTGSNAFLLSSDLATLFGGRVFEIKVYPFSFKEYLSYFPSDNIDASFDEYFKKGGMSGSYLYNIDSDSLKYIESIVKTTIVKDIIDKYKIENEDLLKMIYEFLMDNIGNQTSIRNIANKLTSTTYKTNDKTCGTYIDYLCKSFLFYPIQRYDIKGNKYLESDKKYYLSDLAFRRAILGNRFSDIGHLYENLVAIELLRRGYEVYIGKLYSKEIDFIAIKNGKKIYIQVSDDISRPETFEREIAPLKSINDSYPKMIIARTKNETSDYQGIEIIDIARWLLNS
ncbi:MAG: ATP-binding protein [Acholeplasmatales bacterium]|nr:ATP-binding protein [Acholeplasmatales bacterium]